MCKKIGTTLVRIVRVPIPNTGTLPKMEYPCFNRHSQIRLEILKWWQYILMWSFRGKYDKSNPLTSNFEAKPYDSNLWKSITIVWLLIGNMVLWLVVSSRNINAWHDCWVAPGSFWRISWITLGMSKIILQ